MGKITYEYVKQFIEKESNCKLLSAEYINSRTKMLLKCSCGKEFFVNWDKFKAGQRVCNDCKRKQINESMRFTLDEIKEYVEKNSSCKILSDEYINALEPLNFICKCGNSFIRSFDGFKQSKHKMCLKCSREEVSKKQRFSIDYVKKYIETNSNCILLSTEYKNNAEPLKIQCGCGEIFYRSFDVFTRNKENHECEKCSILRVADFRRNNYDDVKNFIEGNSNCKLLSTEYKTGKDDLILKCGCGNVFKTPFFTFRDNNKRQCNDCSGVVVYDINGVKEYVNLNSDCELLSSEYNNMNDKLTFKCKCGEVFTTTFAIFKFNNKKQCDKCGYEITALKLKLSFNEVKQFIEKTGTKLLSTEYINNSEPLLLKCTCGKDFYRSLSSFKCNSHVCPDCNNSNGERLIHEYLLVNNIKNIGQYRFADCKDKYTLPFDFAVLDSNEKLSFLIEFHGEQHFKSVKFFGGDEEFFNRQRRDKIKEDYCKMNGIDILYIRFDDENDIEVILKNKLTEKGLLRINQKEVS